MNFLVHNHFIIDLVNNWRGKFLACKHIEMNLIWTGINIWLLAAGKLEQISIVLLNFDERESRRGRFFFWPRLAQRIIYCCRDSNLRWNVSKKLRSNQIEAIIDWFIELNGRKHSIMSMQIGKKKNFSKDEAECKEKLFKQKRRKKIFGGKF